MKGGFIVLVSTNLALAKSINFNKRNLGLFDLFDEYYENYHHSNTTKYEIKLMIMNFKNFFRHNKLITEITVDDIQSYVNYEYCFNKLKDSTVYLRYQRLKAIFNYAIKKEYLTNNPCKNVNVKRVYYVRRKIDCSRRFIKKILRLFKKTNLYQLIYLDLHTGLRKEELLALTKDDFIYRKFLFWKLPVAIRVAYALIYDNIEKGYIVKTTKSNKERRVDLDFKCSIFMYFYIKKLNQEKLFNILPTVLANSFHEIIKKSNLSKKEQIRFYDLRHIHFSYLILHMKNKAFAIKLVQERAGHSSILQTFNTYTHLLQDSQKQAVKCLNFM